MLHFLKRSRVLLYTLLLLAASCSHSYHITKQEARTYKVKDVTPDNGLANLIQPYKTQIDLKMSEVIGRADITLTKKQPECTLGNFMADAQLRSARKIDPTVNIAVANYGGIRISYLSPGEIKLRNMYELMPFDNMLTIIEVSGNVLHQFCDHMAGLGGWPVSGMSFVIKNKKANNILANGKPLEEQAMYKLAISDYVANGGDNCDFLKTAKQRSTDILIRNALIEYVSDLTAQGKVLYPVLENRVQYAQ
jgi:2',3'-cyclic-nucleotide 2'-phosphodiesterase (5'-nucleotidase family)